MISSVGSEHYLDRVGVTGSNPVSPTKKYTLLMNTYANLLLWVVPIFYLMIIIEIAYGHYKQNQTYKLMDTIASLSSGSTNLLKDILGLTLIKFFWNPEISM